jgi:hypothetical protein
MTSGANRDRNQRGFRRRDDGTVFTTRKERRKARKTEREARFTFTRKTKSKEEKLGAAEMMTEDENSEVEVDSDYEAWCAVLDQQKLITDQQKLITDPVKDQTGVGSNMVPKL